MGRGGGGGVIPNTQKEQLNGENWIRSYTDLVAVLLNTRTVSNKQTKWAWGGGGGGGGRGFQRHKRTVKR